MLSSLLLAALTSFAPLDVAPLAPRASGAHEGQLAHPRAENEGPSGRRAVAALPKRRSETPGAQVGAGAPASGPGLVLTTPESLVSSGPAGGPFEPQDADLLIENSASARRGYRVRSSAAWLRVSSKGGILPGGAREELVVTIDTALSGQLAPGRHAATVSVTDLVSGEVHDCEVILDVDDEGSEPNGKPSASLAVTPAGGFYASGFEGGPFAPATKVYELANGSSAPMSVAVTSDRNWLVPSVAMAQLLAGETLAVRASIDASIVGLYQPGTYVGDLTFTDLTSGEETERSVTLVVSGRSAGAGVTQVSQFGITWYFDRAYEAGQFASGDHWVVGPVTIIGIDPVSTKDAGGRVKHGSMVNPSPMNGTRQGYDSSMYAQYKQAGDYDNSLNVAFEVSPSKPLKLTPNSSLVSTISQPEANVRPQILTAAILTVLPKAAQPGDFRPAYCGKSKAIQFNEGQMDLSLLQRLPIPASVASIRGARAMTSLSDAERMFERVWLDHVPLWIGRYTHPSQNMPDYGREIVDNVSIAAILLHLDLDPTASTAELNALKRNLLVRFVQLGIDFYGIAQDGGTGNWRAAAGHMSGRKWPILFAGLMLGDPGMSRIGRSNEIQFGEDEQTFVVRETSPGVYNQGYGNYTSEDAGKAEWGTSHAMFPQLDDSDWFADPYRLCCTANAWWGQLLAAHVMGATDEWNHDALFDYQDRFLAENARQGVDDWRLSWREWYLELWKTYRASYGPAFQS